MNIIQSFEAEQIARLTGIRAIPDFAAGDTLRVSVRVVEGERTRVQAFEGVCIARSNRGLNSNFTVRKISYGEGVERVFPLYSPNVTAIQVVRRGDVRRAKLYYLRSRSGKSARIAERARGVEEGIAVEPPGSPVAEPVAGQPAPPAPQPEVAAAQAETASPQPEAASAQAEAESPQPEAEAVPPESEPAAPQPEAAQSSPGETSDVR